MDTPRLAIPSLSELVDDDGGDDEDEEEDEEEYDDEEYDDEDEADEDGFHDVNETDEVAFTQIKAHVVDGCCRCAFLESLLDETRLEKDQLKKKKKKLGGKGMFSVLFLSSSLSLFSPSLSRHVSVCF